MGRALYCFPLAFLFIANAVSSNAQKEEAEREQAVAAGGNLTVECALRPEQRADWRLDGAPVPPGMLVSESSAGAKLTARLYAPRARPLHAGVYTCAQGSQRIRVRLTGAAAGTEAAPLADAAAPDAGVTYFELRGNFSLNCTDLTDDKSVPIVWTKDDKSVESVPGLAGHVSLLAAGGAERALLTLASRALETDAGNYTCRAGDAQRRFTLHARPIAKLPADTNVVEGQKLKLTCKILGLPLPPVRWLYSNVSAEDNMTDAEAAFPGRVELRASEQGVAGGELVLAEAARADAGWFRCEPLAPAATPAVTRLRVKDMYAALWPFLGICAEVFILCTIILVYEKRRTKPELDDSDTDNHDQKKS